MGLFSGRSTPPPPTGPRLMPPPPPTPAPAGAPPPPPAPAATLPPMRSAPPAPLPSAASGPFARFSAVTDRIVVVDTETTGVYRSDRVLEVAVVTLNLAGQVIDEWDTLVDPGRDVGPTWIHGITPSMLRNAPAFDDLAAELAARLHGAIVCAHNLPFDLRMLAQEYQLVGYDLHPGAGLDTLAVTGARLAFACAGHGVALSGAHQALGDARATAALVVAVANQFAAAEPLRFASIVTASAPARRHCRSGDVTVTEPPTYLAALSARVTHTNQSGAVAGYLDLLDRAMADLHLDRDERDALTDLAHELGLDDAAIARAHHSWLRDLIAQATADGVVDGDEYDQLLRAAHILHVDADIVRDRTISERTSTDTVTLTPGLAVCFTGVAVDGRGVEVPRDELADHAESMGLRVEDRFTKSRCQLLVAADPDTRSGKAGRARGWGIPIVDAAEFLAAGPGASLTSHTVTVGDAKP